MAWNPEGTPRRFPYRRALVVIGISSLLVSAAGSLWVYRHGMPGGEGPGVETGTTYYCPMHPSYKSDGPGNCPICSMKLVPLGAATPSPEAGAKVQPLEEGAAPSASVGSPPTIRIAPERQQVIGVKYAPAALRPAEVEIRAVGRVAFDETRIAHIHIKVMGWLEDVYVNFIGEPVRKGQPLFSLYSPELVAAQEEYLLALRGQKELGGSSFERVSEGSRALVEAARRRLELWDMTPDQIEAIEKQGKVSRTVTIVSPVSGVVTERAAYHHGRTVTPDMDLYTIVDLSRVWVQAEVYEYELPHVQVGQPAEAILPYDPGRKPLAGKVRFVAPVLDPTTRTAEVRVEFPNPDLSLKPGSFVNVLLRRSLGQRLVIPKVAVMQTGTAQYVFVDKGDGYLEPRPVKAGPEVAAGLVITEGLREGERVVAAANFIVDSESRLKGAFDAMGTPTQPAEAASASTPAIRVDVATRPSPARVGRNQIRVSVADAAGRAIDDAEVGVRLFMPQMIGMAAVDVRTNLRPVGMGEYAGEIEIPIAWTFSTTVIVRRAGQVIGTAETSITAR
jgi:Cu(I)/Ag(I) efflux system membrane fusion protein